MQWRATPFVGSPLGSVTDEVNLFIEIIVNYALVIRDKNDTYRFLKTYVLTLALTSRLTLLQREYPELKSEIVKVSALSENNITLYFNNVSLLESNWTIEGLNLVVDQSHLFDSLIFLQGKEDKETVKYVHIYQSSFAHLHVRDGYEVNILQCSLKEKFINYNMMDFVQSSITIIDSIFDFLLCPDGSSLLRAESSKVKIKDVTIRQTSTFQDLIRVENNSQLDLENVLFTKNMFHDQSEFSAFVSLTSHSSAVIKNSTFSFNTGGCLYLSYFSKLSVQNCTFSTNMGVSTGVISAKGINTSLSVWRTKFYANIATGGDIHVEATTADVLECSFISASASVYNYNISHSDLLYNAFVRNLYDLKNTHRTFVRIHQHTGLRVKDSFFKGEGIALEGETNIQGTFINCTFTDNTVVFKGGNRAIISLNSCRINNTRNEDESIISLTDNSKLYITNTKITHHDVSFGPVFMNISSSYVRLKECLCMGNTFDLFIRAENNTNILVDDSTFIGNEAWLTKAGLFDITRGRIMIQNSHFINNTAGHGIVVRANESVVELIGNILEGNSPSVLEGIASNITIKATIFSNNILLTWRIHLKGFTIDLRNYSPIKSTLRLHNCTFINSNRGLSIVGYHEINIQNTLFQETLALQISNVPFMRVAHSTFDTTGVDSTHWQITGNTYYPIDWTLLTFNTSFNNDNISITTSVDSFIQKAVKEEFIKIFKALYPDHRETEYASGQYIKTEKYISQQNKCKPCSCLHLYSTFPVIHKVDNVGIFIQLLI